MVKQKNTNNIKMNKKGKIRIGRKRGTKKRPRTKTK
jgi:hypothetical protein